MASIGQKFVPRPILNPSFGLIQMEFLLLLLMQERSLVPFLASAIHGTPVPLSSSRSYLLPTNIVAKELPAIS